MSQNGDERGDFTLSFNLITGGQYTNDCSSTLPPENCSNNIDDNGDNLVDCADPYCGKPSIQSVLSNAPNNCPLLNNGSIDITAALPPGSQGGQIQYSINGGGAFYSGKLFQGLFPGDYAVRVRNSFTGCFSNYVSNPIALTGLPCVEICNNNQDDDGDGKIDCADPDCGPANLAWLAPPHSVCPGSPFGLTLKGAKTGYDFELFRNGTSMTKISGSGDTLLFYPLSISDTAVFHVVAKSQANPICVLNFAADAVTVVPGSLELIVDTVENEGSAGNDGRIALCLPAGVPPFFLECTPRPGSVDSLDPGPPGLNCLEYLNLKNLPASHYKIKITDATGCAGSIVVFVGNPEKRRIGFPEKPLLTPNGDGFNDALKFTGLFELPDDNELFIYNRYGNLLYHAKPYANDWDGSYNGEPVPAGTYFYTLRVGPENTTYSGFITVLR